MFTHTKTTAVSLATIFAATPTAYALQDAADESFALEEVIVTAQKRAQDIQDVAVSMSSFDSELAQVLGFDIAVIAGQVPNVEAYGGNTIVPSFYVRGIGLNEFSGNFNGPVAIHRDEVYTSKNWMMGQPLYDLERVEVLKGPQGTVFGRNAIGGSVNYFTKAPTQETNGYILATADEFERYSIEGAVGGGLTDELSGRISVYTGFGSGGPQFNLFDNDEHGRPDVYQARGQLQWEGENTTVRLLAYGGVDDSELTAYKSPGILEAGTGALCPEAISGEIAQNHSACTRYAGLAAALGFPEAELTDPDTFTVNQNRTARRNDEFAGGYLRIDHDIGDLTLTSLSSFDYYRRDQQDDTDNSPLATADTDWFSEITVFTQELRLTGNIFNDRSFFVLGAFYERDDLDVVESIEGTGAPGPTHPFNLLVPGALPPRLVGDYEQSIDSFAVFLDYNYDLTDRLTLMAGGRFTTESTDIDGLTYAGLNDVVGREDRPQTILAVIDQINDTVTGPGIESNSRTDNDFSWKLGVNYDLSDDAMIYGTVQTAFRTGGFSVAIGGPIVEFEEENVTSAEVGLKSRLFDNTVQFNAAAFWYEYENHQANVDDPASPLVPITRNLPLVESFGFEADVQWAPTANFELRLGAAYLDSEVKDAGGRTAQTLSNLGPIPLEGNRLTNMPEFQLNGLVRYTQPITDDLVVNSIVDFRWSTSRFMELTNQPADRIGSYGVVNARIALGPQDGRWDIALFARNLFDEEYQTYLNNILAAAVRVDIFGDPQTFGLQLGYRFN